jgi:hypothetical protein
LPGITSGGPNPPDGIDYKPPDSMLYDLTDGSTVSLNARDLFGTRPMFWGYTP